MSGQAPVQFIASTGEYAWDTTSLTGVIIGTTNQVTVVNDGNTITFGTPQNIDTNADVTFNSLTLTGGFKPGPISSDLSPGTDAKYNLGTGLFRWLNGNFSGTVELGGLNPSNIVSCNSSRQLVSPAITNNNGCATSVAADGSVTFSMTQGLRTTDTPTFKNALFTDLSTSSFVATDSKGALISKTLSVNNAVVSADTNGNLQNTTLAATSTNGGNSTLSYNTGILTLNSSIDSSANVNLASLHLSGTLQAVGSATVGNLSTNIMSIFGAGRIVDNSVAVNSLIATDSGKVYRALTSSTSPSFSGSVSAAGISSSADITAGTNSITGGSGSFSSLTSSGTMSATDGTFRGLTITGVADKSIWLTGGGGILAGLIQGSTLSITGDSTIAALACSSINVSGLTGPKFVSVDAKGNLGTADLAVENSLVSADTSGVLQTTSISVSTSNGATGNLAYAAGVLSATFSNVQDISTSATPSWRGVNAGTNGVVSTGVIASAITTGTNTSNSALTNGPINSGQSAIRMGIDNTVAIHPAFIWVDQTGTQTLSFASKAGASPYTTTTADVTISQSAMTSNVPITSGTNSLTAGASTLANLSVTGTTSLSNTLTSHAINAGTFGMTCGALSSSGNIDNGTNALFTGAISSGSISFVNTTACSSVAQNGGAQTTISIANFTRSLDASFGEVYRSDPNYAGSGVSTNWTSDDGSVSLLGLCGQYPYGLFNHSGTSGGWLKLNIGSIPVGVYMLEYCHGKQNNSGINGVFFEANGAISFSRLRADYDCYSVTSVSLPMREVFVIYLTGNCTFQWLNNGKNASSSSNFVCIPGPVVVTKIA